jgi:hypothetical protein
VGRVGVVAVSDRIDFFLRRIGGDWSFAALYIIMIRKRRRWQMGSDTGEMLS